MPLLDVAPATDSGYASRRYAHSLEEFGAPVELPASRGWLLARAIPDSPHQDGMSCYPLFSCQNWNALAEDLEQLAKRLVCVSLVTDPFADVAIHELQAAFPDVCYPYKQHFVTDLSRPLDEILESHHRRNVRKALNQVEVNRPAAGPELRQSWQRLYDNLILRHAIQGIAKFSPLSFERQMDVSGFTAFSAVKDGVPCGMMLWYVRGEVAYYHLAAYSDAGYDAGASFALFWTALGHFACSGVRWAALGAGAGAHAAESGLNRFKRGWATETRPAYFCGRVLQQDVYRRLTANAPQTTDFFPAYRRP